MENFTSFIISDLLVYLSFFPFIYYVNKVLFLKKDIINLIALTKNYKPPTGVEPMTSRLLSECSTTKLKRLIIIINI